MSDLAKFNEFLSKINLGSLRDQYQKIKTVELDMPKNVLPLECIYDEYWKKRKDWVGYKKFYKIYKNSLQSELKVWRKDSYFSKKTFNIGLAARIYRIWASLLTQIQGGYVAEKIYGKGKVSMDVETDRMGIDISIEVEPERIIQIQVKKLSWRNVARRQPKEGSQIVNLVYEVPPEKHRLDGEIRVPYQRWEEKWGDKLEVLDNGFVVFKKSMFKKEHLLQLQK